jgi:hypothetical protein
MPAAHYAEVICIGWNIGCNYDKKTGLTSTDRSKNPDYFRHSANDQTDMERKCSEMFSAISFAADAIATNNSLKAGAEARFKRGSAARFYFGDFRFTSQETGRDFTRADAVTGTPWASFVLGALNPSGANVRYNVLQIANTEMYGFYFQDDYKISQKVTVLFISGRPFKFLRCYVTRRFDSGWQLYDPVRDWSWGLDERHAGSRVLFL